MKTKCTYAVLLLAWFLWLELQSTKAESPNEKISSWEAYPTTFDSKKACESSKDWQLRNAERLVGGKRLGNSDSYIMPSGRQANLSCHPKGFDPEKKKAEKFKSI